MSRDIDEIWARLQGELASTVDESTFRIWLAPLRPRELQHGRLLIEVPAQARDWVPARFGRLIRALASGVAGPDTAVEFTAAPDAGDRAGSARHSRWSKASAVAGEQVRGCGGEGAFEGAAAGANPLDNPKLTFDQFVIGTSNHLAHAAALAVAEMPTHAYNPLFICGPPGVGKTHLLGAIAALVRSHNPGLTVRWTTGESFTNEFLGALGAGSTDSFKARFREVDVLLLDDVQFLERKTRTEEEFFHTFNALHDGGRQIVLTCDRPPRDLQALEDRLRERFQSGLVADIAPPELGTRLTILRKRVQHDDIELADEDALQLLAKRVHYNVRALEGALIRVVAYGSLTGRRLSQELVGEVLDKLYPDAIEGSQSARRSIADIQAAACAHFGISMQELTSTARASRIAWPRQLAMFLSRELTEESLPAIGRGFGGRDHTTVLHACRRARERVASDPSARAAVEKLCCDLGLQAVPHPDSHDRIS